MKTDKLGDNKTLIVTIGLPYSGKSTWAKETSLPMVNPDSIRIALHGERFMPLMEPYVWAIAKTMVRALFLAGHDRVILDATNTTDKRRAEWYSDDWITIHMLFNADADTCKQRAIEKGDEYILSVIDRMASKCDELVLP